jgi:hypothetical protein
MFSPSFRCPQCPQALGGHGQVHNAACNDTAPKRTGGNGGTPGGIQIMHAYMYA